MKFKYNVIQTKGKIILIGLFLFPLICAAQDSIGSSRLIHKINIEARPSYIFPTNIFLTGYNRNNQNINDAFSGHVRYAFQFQPHTAVDQIFNSPYQGIGITRYNFHNKEELGSPLALYVFQGARIARLHPRVSLNYEWNFGLSFGWKPYDNMDNNYNVIIGSKENAYINANLYLNWMISKYVDLTLGTGLTHFSNGNTSFPNAGLNTLDFKIGLVYNINREEKTLTKPLYCYAIPEFKRHVSYDVVLFGSWRRKGTVTDGSQVAMLDKYTVLGVNVNPMYNLGYRFRIGASFDGIYDKSANIFKKNDWEYYSPTDEEFIKPPLSAQVALGLSARAEYVMPYFTVGIGIGANVLHRGGDFKAIYQIMSLKTEITRNSFLHIGYSLNDFHDPNYLMLGIGYRFNNKSPQLHRRQRQGAASRFPCGR